ncbi:MAG TPA: hypothetical protein VF070_49675 [Streptosporangiaceae bacterium]
MRSSSVVVSRPAGRSHSDRQASSGHTAVDRAPASRMTRRIRSATLRELAPPLQSMTTSSGWACRRTPPAMNPAHRRSSSVVLPVPVVPMTTWCERSLE